MRLAEVVAASRAVAGTAARLEKISHLVDLLTHVPPDEIAIVIAFLSGEPRQGRMKIGAALLSGMRDVPPADAPSLDVVEVDAAFDRIAALSGAGSAAHARRSSCASSSAGRRATSRTFSCGCSSASCGRARSRAS